MLDMARKATDFVAGKTRTDLDTDEKLALALVRALEIIGEAANHVSPQVRSELPGIPWRQVIGMRNRIIHAYYDVNLDIVWETIRDDLPTVIAAVEAALSS
jgi:uncharacterized protein with HEPN domain